MTPPKIHSGGRIGLLGGQFLRILSFFFLVLLLLTPSWAALCGRYSSCSGPTSTTDMSRPDRRLGEGPVRWSGPATGVLALTGDLVDNKCPPEEFWKRIEGFLGTWAPRLLSARVPLILTLGNNDVPSNYQTEPGAQARVLASWRRHLGPSFYLDDLGNGVHPETVAGMTWISLNSLVFSPRNQFEGKGLQAHRTLKWLQQQLAALPEGRPVVLASHIPPTWDQFGHARSGPGRDSALTVLEGHRARLVLSGHFHRNELTRSFPSDGRAVPILAAGAFPGKHGYRPNWRSYYWTLDSRSWPQRINWRNRYLADSRWDQTWQVDQPGLSRTWSQYVIRLANNPRFYLDYMRDFWANQDSWRANALKPGVREGIRRGLRASALGSRGLGVSSRTGRCGAASTSGRRGATSRRASGAGGPGCRRFGPGILREAGTACSPRLGRRVPRRAGISVRSVRASRWPGEVCPVGTR